jgi:cytochrome c oxidase accessory protein FixG
MFDRDTLTIGYDRARGESRGSRTRSADPKALGLGDCIDCTLCVQVCPTGIDIRNGLQNECIGCAACIDVCDGVMDKMGYPPGLIRYSTENGVAGGWSKAQMFRRALRPRVLIYAAVLCIASAAFATSVAVRKPFLFDVIKDRASLGRVVEEGAVENVYRLQVMNRSETPQRFRVTVGGLPELAMAATELHVPAAGIESAVVTVRLPGAQVQRLQGGSVAVVFEVALQAEPPRSPVVLSEKSTFFVPR